MVRKQRPTNMVLSLGNRMYTVAWVRRIGWMAHYGLSRRLPQSKYWCKVEQGISDHKMVIAHVTTTHALAKKNKTLSVLDLSKADDTGLLYHLEQNNDAFAQFISVNTTPVNDAWKMFKNMVLKSIELCVLKRFKKVHIANIHGLHGK